MVSGITDLVQSWGSTLVVLSAGAAYAAYYFKRVVHKPTITCGSTKLEEFIHRHVPSVRQIYWPPFWCFQAHMHTVLAVLFRSFIKRSYRREVIATPDGGQIFLDWTDADDTSSFPPDKRPTVVIMPGLTGSSKEAYIKHFADDLHQIGFRSVVFNQRGFAGATLKTPRGFCAGNTEDLHCVVTHIKSIYPGAPIAGLGLSIGGIILLNYLAEYGEEAQIVGALPVSALYDLTQSNTHMERNLNWLLFNSYLTSNLRKYLQSNKQMIEDKYDVDHILQSTTIYEFDNRMTAAMFGYRDADHYYVEASPHNKLHKIKIPTLCLNAADDPFTPFHTLPLDSVMECSHTAIVVSKHGGHLGFMYGMLPIGKSLISKVLTEFMTAIFNHGEDLAV